MTPNPNPSPELLPDDGFVSCDCCGGRFDRGDMVDDHCHDCHDELFGDEE